MYAMKQSHKTPPEAPTAHAINVARSHFVLFTFGTENAISQAKTRAIAA
jgi:hypothetical protein